MTAALVLAAHPALSQTEVLLCEITAGMAARDFAIEIAGGRALPLGAAYERIQKSTSRVQYVSYRVTDERIDILVRDGNDGEQFIVDRRTGHFAFERLTDLDHSGTERIVQQGTGTCTAAAQAFKPN